MGVAVLRPSFPRKRESRRYCLMMVLSAGNRGIPAYAARAVGAASTVLIRHKNPVYLCLIRPPLGREGRLP